MLENSTGSLVRISYFFLFCAVCLHLKNVILSCNKSPWRIVIGPSVFSDSTDQVQAICSKYGPHILIDIIPHVVFCIFSLDELLDGGLYTGELTEIVGAAGVGKSQVWYSVHALNTFLFYALNLPLANTKDSSDGMKHFTNPLLVHTYAAAVIFFHIELILIDGCLYTGELRLHSVILPL